MWKDVVNAEIEILCSNNSESPIQIQFEYKTLVKSSESETQLPENDLNYLDLPLFYEYYRPKFTIGRRQKDIDWFSEIETSNSDEILEVNFDQIGFLTHSQNRERHRERRRRKNHSKHKFHWEQGR